MTMSPTLRKLTLTAHVTVSVGWLGAVAGFLALTIVGLNTQDIQMARAVYPAMNVIAWYVILPSAFLALLTGIVQGLGTTWGLVRYYWVLAKLALTTFATIILLLKMRLISYVAKAAQDANVSLTDLRQAKLELLVHAGGGLVVLLIITVLSVFKPWGKTPYGRRDSQPISASPENRDRNRIKILFAVAGAILLGFLVLHLVGGGVALHGR